MARLILLRVTKWRFTYSFLIYSFNYFIALFHCLDIPFTINVYLNLYNKIRIFMYIYISSNLKEDLEPRTTSVG